MLKLYEVYVFGQIEVKPVCPLLKCITRCNEDSINSRKRTEVNTVSSCRNSSVWLIITADIEQGF